jgi:hypothetical protein
MAPASLFFIRTVIILKDHLFSGVQIFDQAGTPKTLRVCTACEKEGLSAGFPVRLAGPARRTLENAGILALNNPAILSEVHILKLNGSDQLSFNNCGQHWHQNSCHFLNKNLTLPFIFCHFTFPNCYVKYMTINH